MGIPNPQLSAHRVAGIIGTGPWPSPAYDSLTRELARAIGDGRLPTGARLPSERELADRIGLSRTTTTRAYGQLRDQGYVRTRRGSGSVVRMPEIPGGRVDHLLAPAGLADDEIDLTCTAPTAPAGVVDAYDRALHHLGAYLTGTGYYPSGIPVLREEVARRFTARGLTTDADQIIITPGALSAVAIAARTLLGGRGRVVIESPTYPNVIATLEEAGARLVPYPLEIGEGGHVWDAEALLTTIAQARATTAYLIPDFHNPTGALMDEPLRRRLGAALTASGTVPIIDESLAEIALDRTEIPQPLGAFVPDSITVGSMSKTHWGGLRVGWMRVPHERIASIAANRLSLDLGTAVLEQLVALELLRDHDSIIAAQRTRLRRGRDILIDQVRTHLPEWEVRVPTGGMALWCRLPAARSTALAVAARAHGVVLASGPNFAPAGGLDRWIRLPFTAPEAQLEQIGERLAAAWHEALSSGAPAVRRTAPIVA